MASVRASASDPQQARDDGGGEGLRGSRPGHAGGPAEVFDEGVDGLGETGGGHDGEEESGGAGGDAETVDEEGGGPGAGAGWAGDELAEGFAGAGALGDGVLADARLVGFDFGEGRAKRLGDAVVGGEPAEAVGGEAEHGEVEGIEVEGATLAAAGKEREEEAPKDADQGEIGRPLLGDGSRFGTVGHRRLLSRV